MRPARWNGALAGMGVVAAAGAGGSGAATAGAGCATGVPGGNPGGGPDCWAPRRPPPPDCGWPDGSWPGDAVPGDGVGAAGAPGCTDGGPGARAPVGGGVVLDAGGCPGGVDVGGT